MLRYLIIRTITGKDPNSYYDRKTLIVINILCAAVVIIAVLCFVMNPKDEYKEWLIEENVPAAMDIFGLGFAESETMQASVYSYTLNSERIGTSCQTSVYDEEKGLSLSLYVLNETADTEAAFQYIVEKEYTSSQKTFIDTKRQYMPTVKYERAVEQMIRLNESSWNAELVYALSSLDADNSNLILMKRKHEIIVLDYHGIQITEEAQEIFLNGIDEMIIQISSE